MSHSFSKKTIALLLASGMIGTSIFSNTYAVGAISDLFEYRQNIDSYFLMGSGITDSSISESKLTPEAHFWTTTNWLQEVHTTNNVNVGIGTWTPQAKLEVDGGGGDRLGFYKSGENTLAIQTLLDGASLNTYGTYGGDGENRLILQPLVGNVGIGTLNPSAKLEVAGSSSDHLDALSLYNTVPYGVVGTNQETRLNLGKIENGARQPMASIVAAPTDYNNSTEGFLSLYTRAGNSLSERMRITNAGNVGIGTSTPQQKLDVAGMIRSSTGGVQFPDGSIQVSAGQVTTGTRLDAGLQGNAARSGFYQNDGSSVVNYPAGASSWWHLMDVRHTNDANNYAMQIAGSFFDQDLYFRKTNNNPATPWNKFVYQNSAGNVGIGTTSPLAKLDISGAATRFLANTYSMDLSVSGTAGGWARAFRVTNRDNSPNGQDGAAFGAMGAGTTPSYAYMAIPTSDQTGYNSSKILVLNNAGNVGIGTTAPAVALDVSGQIRQGAQSMQTGWSGISGWDVYAHASVGAGDGTTVRSYFNSSGNGYLSNSLGIWTSSPNAKLEIRGDTHLDWENGPLMVVSAANPAQKVSIGYDHDNDVGFISALQSGVAWKNLIIQSGGGNVGIGTISPKSKLNISGSDFVTQTISNTGDWSSIAFKPNNAGKALIMHYGSSGNELRFGRYSSAWTVGGGGWEANPVTFDMDAPSSSLVIAGDGNIYTGNALGIGGVWPSEKLDVNGYVRVRSTNWEGGTIRLDGNNGTNMHLENINGDFRLVNSPWNWEPFRVTQGGNVYADKGAGVKTTCVGNCF